MVLGSTLESNGSTYDQTVAMNIEQTTSEDLEQQLVLSESVDDQVWDAFVKNHPHGSPFHLRAWQSLIEESFGHRPYHLAARTSPNGPIMGVLPLFLVRSRIFGRMLISTNLEANLT